MPTRARISSRTRGDPPGGTGGSLVVPSGLPAAAALLADRHVALAVLLASQTQKPGPPSWACHYQATVSIHLLAVRFVVPPRQARGPVARGRLAARGLEGREPPGRAGLGRVPETLPAPGCVGLGRRPAGPNSSR
jgi:hypothetical protein